MTKPTVAIIAFEAHYGVQGRAVYDLCVQLHNDFNLTLICKATNSILHEQCRPFVQSSLPLQFSKFPTRDILRSRKFIKQNKVRLLHIHGFSGLLWGHALAIICGLPVIFTPYPIEKRNPILFALVRKVWQFCSRYTSLLIAVSKDEANDLIRWRVIRKEKISTIIPGIERPLLTAIPDKQPTIEGITAQRWVVLCSDLSTEANPICFVRAASLLSHKTPDLAFLIIGEGLLFNRLHNEIVQQNLQQTVFLVGDRSDKLAIMKHAWVVVSTSRSVGIPFHLIDAAFLAKVIVTPAFNGIQNFITDGVSGMHYGFDNAHALAQRLYILYCNDSLGPQMGIAAKKAVENQYSSSSMGHLHRKAYLVALRHQMHLARTHTTEISTNSDKRKLSFH